MSRTFWTFFVRPDVDGAATGNGLDTGPQSQVRLPETICVLDCRDLAEPACGLLVGGDKSPLPASDGLRGRSLERSPDGISVKYAMDEIMTNPNAAHPGVRRRILGMVSVERLPG